MNKSKLILTEAKALIKGDKNHPELHGTALFRQMKKGVLVTVEVWGLPYFGDCHSGVFGMHIHDGKSCSGDADDAFADALMHYNPKNCPHPYHAGDLPPLFGNQGYAYLSVFTDRFRVSDILGRVIIIHSRPDDFTTQPSGASGDKIACGKILYLR